jgi:hypothetical protein
MKDKSNAGHKHTASDRALDQAAQDQKVEAKGPGHDPAEIAKHDDVGKDRLFEGREQHDEADKNSEKNRSDRVGSPIDEGRVSDRQHQ